MEVVFCSKYVWALPPYAQRGEEESGEAEAALYANNFRWARRKRRDAAGAPWRSVETLGWIIPSPIDIRVAPLYEAQVALSLHERPDFAVETGLNYFWPRPSEEGEHKDELMASAPVGWIEATQFPSHGGWSHAFYPLGEGFFEWRLGWEMRLPADYWAIVLPLSDQAEIEVAPGLLNAPSLERLNSSWGMALAFRPKHAVAIQRGQPIARLIVLHADSLRARARMEDVFAGENREDSPGA